MRMYDLITKKRDGGHLTKDEISFMITNYTNGNIPDYQMSAMMMAIFFVGMDDEETVNLTIEMAHSGDILDLSMIEGIKADKHSTGGVGDKTSLALIPMVAACGLKIAKMSGRGLGHTGGTIDKLESFSGFNTAISNEKFIQDVKEIGVSLMGQTKNLAPADKKLYALRDVTGTVNNMSLIASSIMSKKLASGADVIVLDVKTGSGAFMKTEEDSRKLAEEMVRIGKGAGRKVMAVISDMDQPLGYMVGNALEVKEAIDTLNGKGPEDFTALCMSLGTNMLLLSDIVKTKEEAESRLREVINDGKALEKLADLVEAQGGNRDEVYNKDLLPKAELQIEIKSENDGYISAINCEEIGICSLILGGGRETIESEIDLSVGIEFKLKVGSKVSVGDTIAVVHANDNSKANIAIERFRKAVSYSQIKPKDRNVIIGEIN